MTTPKELADKAKREAEDMADRACGTDCGEFVSKERDALHATIDQLQAMAEARQGSGEPVAWLRVHTRDGRIWGHTQEEPTTEEQELAKLDGNELRPVVYQAPPSAQQATDSGQVLTDEAIEKLLTEFHRVSNRMGQLWNQCQGKGWPDKESAEFDRLRDEVVPDLRRRILAAATQAQPEVEALYREVGRKMVEITTTVRDPDEWLCIPELWLQCMKERDDALSKLAALAAATQAPPEVPAGWKLVPVEPTEEMLAAVYSGKFMGGPGADYRNMLDAAPTTGKREPLEIDVECLTDESGTDYSVVVRGGGLRMTSRSDVWMKRKPAEKLAKWLTELLHGITGEQR